MKGLLIKDIKLMKNMIRLVGIIIIFSVVFSTLGENIFFSMGYVSVFVAILSITSINYDEYDNGFAYLFTFPFERKQYVQEKYVFGIGLIFIGITISGIISFAISQLTGTKVTAEEWVAVTVASISVAFFMIAVVLPAHIKYGGEKGRIAMVILFLGMGIIAYGIYGLSEMIGFDIESKLDALFYSPVKMMMTAGGVSVIVLAVSYVISVGIIEKKEF